MTPTTTYEQWQEGEIQGDQALAELCRSLDALDDRLEPLQQQKETLRAQISELVEHLGGKVELDWFGALQITNASVTSQYDREALDALVIRLRSEGQDDLAQRIEGCRKESMRSGGLRIKRARS